MVFEQQVSSITCASRVSDVYVSYSMHKSYALCVSWMHTRFFANSKQHSTVYKTCHTSLLESSKNNKLTLISYYTGKGTGLLNMGLGLLVSSLNS